MCIAVPSVDVPVTATPAACPESAIICVEVLSRLANCWGVNTLTRREASVWVSTPLLSIS